MEKFEFKRSTKKYKYFNGIILKEPSEKEFNKYIDIWNKKYNKELAGDFSHEKILDYVFTKNNSSNKNILEMYEKCVLLDKLYSTNVKHMDSLVKHLASIENFNEMLSSGNPELVNVMKMVEKDDGTIIKYMSFASKYCRRYNPKDFPVFDTIVKDIFSHYLYTLKFYRRRDKIDLTDYVSFKNVADEFLNAYPFVKDYVQLDHYLWTMGKEKLQAISYIKKIRKSKDDLKQIQNIAKIENFSGDLLNLENFIVNKYDL